MMMSYQLLMMFFLPKDQSFFTNRIQTLQYQSKKCIDSKENYVKNKPHLVTF